MFELWPDRRSDTNRLVSGERLRMSVGFSISLPRDPSAARIARTAVHEELASALPPSILADVTLAVSELVTNAVIHGGGEIELRVEAGDRVVKGEVIDGGVGFEQRLRDREVTGRGLEIVGQLSKSWGVFQGTTHVWFEIPVDGASPREVTPAIGHPDDAKLPDI
jgi:anti-sigma regulatory factor (Ser/Thr protein kinase)